LTPERSIDLCLQTFPKLLLLLVPKVTTCSLYPECVANLKLPIDTFYRESCSGVNIAKRNITTGLFGLRSSGKVLRSFEEISMYKKLELLIVHPIIWVKCVFYSLCKTSWRYVPFVGVYREAEKLCHISMSWDHAGYMFCFAYLIRIHLEKMIHVVTRAFSFFFNVHNSCMLFYFVQCIA
jgi:hypothetical protein